MSESLVSDIPGQVTPAVLSGSEQALFLIATTPASPFRLVWHQLFHPSQRFIVCHFFQRLLVSTSWHRLLSDGHIVLIAGAIWLSTSTMAILEPCLPIWLMDNIKPRVNRRLHLKQVCSNKTKMQTKQNCHHLLDAKWRSFLKLFS